MTNGEKIRQISAWLEWLDEERVTEMVMAGVRNFAETHKKKRVYTVNNITYGLFDRSGGRGGKNEAKGGVAERGGEKGVRQKLRNDR